VNPCQLRQYRNEFTSGEGAFVSVDDFDGCTSNYNPPAIDTTLDVWVGLDGSVKHDSTALAAVAWQDGRLRLIAHREFRPTAAKPIDFALTLSARLRTGGGSIASKRWRSIRISYRRRLRTCVAKA
jgi:hypothetical protein